MPIIFEVFGQSGSRYVIQQVLQEKECPTRRVYLASAGKHMFVVKDIHQGNLEDLLDIYCRVGSCPYIRSLHDTVPGYSMFVYKYCTGHLLNLARKKLPLALVKRILKDALRGLAALHDQNIVHNGPEFDICDLLVGNQLWRSPEAHASGRVNTPSDMFSFGIVCVYAVTKRLIFAVDKDEIEEGSDVLAVILQRQFSYFAEEDGFNGLLKHLGDSHWCENFRVIRDSFDETHPLMPVSMWKGHNIDADFRDLIGGLTNFDPAKRITAHEALAHRWFADLGTDE